MSLSKQDLQDVIAVIESLNELTSTTGVSISGYDGGPIVLWSDGDDIAQVHLEDGEYKLRSMP